jgi:hypothetical protein
MGTDVPLPPLRRSTATTMKSALGSFVADAEGRCIRRKPIGVGPARRRGMARS